MSHNDEVAFGNKLDREKGRLLLDSLFKAYKLLKAVKRQTKKQTPDFNLYNAVKG